jgi:hypothetical protein
MELSGVTEDLRQQVALLSSKKRARGEGDALVYLTTQRRVWLLAKLR